MKTVWYVNEICVFCRTYEAVQSMGGPVCSLRYSFSFWEDRHDCSSAVWFLEESMFSDYTLQHTFLNFDDNNVRLQEIVIL